MAIVTYAKTDITLANATATILRPTGRQNDPNAATAAYEAIRDTLQSLNTKRDWTWLQNAAVAASDATGLLTLPARIKKIYTIFIPGVAALSHMPERRWRLINPLSTNIGGTMFYTPYNIANTGKIQLRDAPVNNTSVTVDYLALITIPANNATDGALALDIPEVVSPYVLAESRAQLLGDLGQDLGDWPRKALTLLEALESDDPREQNFLDSRMIPNVEINGDFTDYGNNA